MPEYGMNARVIKENTYYTSWEVAERRDIDNAIRINIRDMRQKVMLEEMLKDPSVRIQYSSFLHFRENIVYCYTET